jgi:hypothetical protein
MSFTAEIRTNDLPYRTTFRKWTPLQFHCCMPDVLFLLGELREWLYSAWSGSPSCGKLCEIPGFRRGVVEIFAVARRWLAACYQRSGTKCGPHLQVSVHGDCSHNKAFFYVIQLYVVASKVPGITLFLRNTKYKNHLSYISPSSFPSTLWKYTPFPATVKCWKRSWKQFCESLFQLFRRILSCVNSITKVPYLHCWFQSRERVKIGGSQVNESVGMLLCCHIVLC